MIARETNEEGAVTLAERIRSTVEHTPIEYKGHQISVTVSIGVSVADSGIPATYADMNEVAAAALQQAKQAGKNCCVVRSVHTAPTAPPLESSTSA